MFEETKTVRACVWSVFPCCLMRCRYRGRTKCGVETCSFSACCGKQGSTKREFCARHALKGMIRLDAKGCVHPGCLLEASYGIKGNGRTREFCARHASDQHVDTLPRSARKRKQCHGPGCTTAPSYGKAGSGKREFCRSHALLGMTYRGRPICRQPGCSMSVRTRTVGESVENLGFCPRHVLLSAAEVSGTSTPYVHSGECKETMLSSCLSVRRSKTEEFCQQYRSKENALMSERGAMSTSSWSSESHVVTTIGPHGDENDECGVVGQSYRPLSSEHCRCEQDDDGMVVVGVGNRQKPCAQGWQPRARASNNSSSSSIGETVHAERAARRESRDCRRCSSTSTRQGKNTAGEARPTSTDQNRFVNGTLEETSGGSISPRSNVSTRCTCSISNSCNSIISGTSTTDTTTNRRTVTVSREHGVSFQSSLGVHARAQEESLGGHTRGGSPPEPSAISRARSCSPMEPPPTTHLNDRNGPPQGSGSLGTDRSRSERDGSIFGSPSPSNPAAGASTEDGAIESSLVGSMGLSSGRTAAGSQSDEQAREETSHDESHRLLTEQGWVKWDWKSALFKAAICRRSIDVS